MKYLFIAFGVFMLVNVNPAAAQEIPVITIFHGRECPNCQAEFKWIPKLEKMYPGVEIKEYEIWHNPAFKVLAQAQLEKLGKTLTGVPTNIINGDVVVGFQPDKILKIMKKHYGPPQEIKEGDLEPSGEIENWVWALMWLFLGGAGFLIYKKKK